MPLGEGPVPLVEGPAGNTLVSGVAAGLLVLPLWPGWRLGATQTVRFVRRSLSSVNFLGLSEVQALGIPRRSSHLGRRPAAAAVGPTAAAQREAAPVGATSAVPALARRRPRRATTAPIVGGAKAALRREALRTALHDEIVLGN